MSLLSQKNPWRTKAGGFAQSLNVHTLRLLALFAAVLSVTCVDTNLQAQDRFKNFSATNVFREVNGGGSSTPDALLVDAWWDQHVQNSMREVQPLPADLHTILYLAIHHSNQIKIAKMDPLIRETAVQEADSAFDWTRYLNTAWNDTSEPVSNALTVGGNENRFNDQTFQSSAGVRRTTRSGGQLDIAQRFGWQDNNSQFFTPNDQATGRLTLSYTHPLLRGRGSAYNNAIVFLAQIDSTVAQDEFLGVLQDELLEITRAYWNLHLERAVLAHQLRLYLKTKEIYKTLTARQAIDAQGTQAVLAASALESRRADLIRAQTAVTNSETRLRGMINAQELGNSDELELIPSEPLPDFTYQTDLRNEIQVALQNRPEVRAAVRQVKAGSLRLGVAKHELLPALNLVTQGYLAGLRGNNDFSGALGDQFTTGRPSYSVGLQYELPVGNRLAKARVCRRQHELTRLQSEYARALQAVQVEVDIAVRELQTAHREIDAKRRALAAAEAEVNTIEQRWKLLIDGSGTSSLNLESLLRAQERVTVAEREYVTSQLTYSLAMVNLKRANGTLLQSESISITPTCDPTGCRNLVLEKHAPGMAGQAPASSCGPNCGCETCSSQKNVAPEDAFKIDDDFQDNDNDFKVANEFNTEENSPLLTGSSGSSGSQWESTVVGPQPNRGVRVANAKAVPTGARSVIVERQDRSAFPAPRTPQRTMTAPAQNGSAAPATPWGAFDYEKQQPDVTPAQPANTTFAAAQPMRMAPVTNIPNVIMDQPKANPRTSLSSQIKQKYQKLRSLVSRRPNAKQQSINPQSQISPSPYPSPYPNANLNAESMRTELTQRAPYSATIPDDRIENPSSTAVPSPSPSPRLYPREQATVATQPLDLPVLDPVSQPTYQPPQLTGQAPQATRQADAAVFTRLPKF